MTLSVSAMPGTTPLIAARVRRGGTELSPNGTTSSSEFIDESSS
jgi:hypothetical protein